MNILVIAGYDVLADKIPDHRWYVQSSFDFGIKESGVELIFTLGGATNPDYPDRTEAEANERIIENSKKIKEKFFPSERKAIEVPVIALPVGNTSAETLDIVKEFVEAQEIFVEKLVLCAEQSRLTGFLLDAFYLGLLDLSEQIIAYGHPFPDSKRDFYSQRKKMLMKVVSYYGFPFTIIRSAYQWFQQRRVARARRRAPRF